MDRVVHFEIPYDNRERASKFYSEIFGWMLVPVPEFEYIHVRAAEIDSNNMVTEKGAINGGMFLRDEIAKNTMIVIGVNSIDETIEKILADGGKVVMPKMPIPNGSYARVMDCEGNVIGLAESA